MSQRLRTWLSRLGGRTQTELPASRHGSNNKTTTALYSCSACETTYSSEEIDVCSKYGESVTQIPTERGLALSTSRI